MILAKQIPQSYVGLCYDIDRFVMNSGYISINTLDYNNFQMEKIEIINKKLEMSFTTCIPP